MTAIAPTMQAFFTERLQGQRQASPNTIAAYRRHVSATARVPPRARHSGFVCAYGFPGGRRPALPYATVSPRRPSRTSARSGRRSGHLGRAPRH
jgi:hypothetical protein